MGRYLDYLRSDEWKERRNAVIKRCSNICEACRLLPVEEIHHETYDRLYNEQLDDLLGLCSHCHAKEHGLTDEGGEEYVADLRALLENDDLRQRFETEFERFLNPNDSWRYWGATPTADVNGLKGELSKDRRFLYGRWECEIIKADVVEVGLVVRLGIQKGGQSHEFRIHGVAQRLRSGMLRLDCERQLFVDIGYLEFGLRILAGPIPPRVKPEPPSIPTADQPPRPPDNLAIEIQRLVITIFELLRRSRGGWVDWADVAAKQGIPADLSMSYADLPQWRHLFRATRKGFVTLTLEGVECAKRLQPREPFVNGFGIKFAWIPFGTFLMGSRSTEEEREPDEAPHSAALTNGFYMGIHPVTQAQWVAVMGRNPSQFKGDSLPMEKVSWDECVDFCEKMSKAEGRHYRLPTEAEWEYACRAGTTTPFHFGVTVSSDQANFDGRAIYGDGVPGEFRQRTTPVGHFPANAWGLYDMHGNVWEWCSDWYGVYPNEDRTDYQGPQNGTERVLRGGAWNFAPKRCRSAYRYRARPVERLKNVGFRICFVPE